MNTLQNVITKDEFIRINKMSLKTSYVKDIKSSKSISETEYYDKVYYSRVVKPNKDLLLALTRCKSKEVQKLFDTNKYISANVIDEHKNRAIDIALQTNCWEIIFFLIAHGAEYKHLVKKFNGVKFAI